MVQAAAAGVVDFGRADPRDPRWWLGLRLVLDRLEQENLREYHRLHHRQVLAVLGRDGLTRESSERLLAAADRRIDQVARILFPWADLDPAAGQARQAERLRASWEAVFGKLDDPETQRQIRATADWLRKANRAPGQGRK